MEEQVNYRNGEIRKFFVTKKKETKTKIIFHVRVNNELRNVTDTKDVDKTPHDTLTKAMRCALPYALLILKEVPKDVKIDPGYINRRQIINDANFIDHELVGIEYKGDDEDKEVNLTVRKHILFGGTVEMKTGFIKLYEKSQFDMSGNLKDSLDDILEEIYQYHEGKNAGSEQAVLFEEEANGEEEEESDNDAF